MQRNCLANRIVPNVGNAKDLLGILHGIFPASRGAAPVAIPAESAENVLCNRRSRKVRRCALILGQAGAICSTGVGLSVQFRCPCMMNVEESWTPSIYTA